MLNKQLLQINSVVNCGSTGRIAEEIGISAMQEGWKSYIAYGRKSNTSKSQILKIGNSIDILNHGIQTRLLDLHGLASIKATKLLIEKMNDIQPNIIHLHNIHGYYVNYKLLFEYIKERKIPVVWTLHDCWSFTGHCAHFDYVGCNKWSTICHQCEQLNRYPKSYFDRSHNNFKSKRSAFTGVENMTLVPVSNWLANLLDHSFLQTYPKIVIKNGIDLETFRPIQERKKAKIKLGFKLSDKIILGVANVWDERKGLKYFVELSDKLPTDYKIVIIGLQKAQLSRLPKQIIGIERTQNISQLVEYYNIADVFLNPTLEDNYPTTNLESIACGTPVITFDTGGSPESIDRNVGLVVPKGNTELLLDSIYSIINSNRESDYTIEQCRNKAIKEFNNKERFRQYILLYESILGS